MRLYIYGLLFFFIFDVCILYFEGCWFKEFGSFFFSVLIWCYEVDVRVVFVWVFVFRIYLIYLVWFGGFLC